MKPQSFKNHSRTIPLWTFITPLLLLTLLVYSVVNFFNVSSELKPGAALIFLGAVIMVILFWYGRWFALRAQDRAIRAEENFRHYLLTGKPFDPRIRMRQVIGLRFASDAEFAELAKKAAEENLSQRQIKELITQWRADHHRV